MDYGGEFPIPSHRHFFEASPPQCGTWSRRELAGGQIPLYVLFGT